MVSYSNAYGCVASLKGLAKLRDLEGGLKLHSYVAESGLLETNAFVGSTLVDMYAKCGSLVKAEQVFQKLLVRDVVSWTALISGYVDHVKFREALDCFDLMQVEGVVPNLVTFSCALRACRSLAMGREVHAEIERRGLLGGDVIIGNSLLDMYAKWGSFAMAQDIFKQLPKRNTVSWTCLMSGYVEHGYYAEAVKCYDDMQLEGVFPNAVTHVSCLKACTCVRAIGKGQDIHAEVERQGLIGKDPFVGSTLVDLYVKCGLLSIAKQVFAKLPTRSIMSWNALISGYYENGDSSEALRCFEQVQVEGTSLDVVTFICSLKACGNLGSTHKGKELHAKIESLGLLESEPVVGNAVVDMYVKCGWLADARQVFEKLLVRDEVSWTALITGYLDHELSEETLECYEQMRLEGVFPDAVTVACILKACGSVGATDKGKEFHAEADRQGMLKQDLVVGNSVVEMYMRCGLLESGHHAFDMLPMRDDFSWNAMLNGYARHGHGKEALKCFERMRAAGISPNAAMFACCMKACGSMGATGKAEELHSEIERLGLLRTDMVVNNALINMYVESGCIINAERVFDKLDVRDVVSWTSLLAGYSQLGDTSSVASFFERMIREGIKPDSVAFLVVLSACARTGVSAHKSQTYISAMTREYGIIPNLKHHGCIANSYCYAGQLEKAFASARKLPQYITTVVWNTILGACKNWGSVKLGEEAFKSALNQEETCS